MMSDDALCDAEAVGECLWSNVPQVNCITTPLRISAFFGIENNRYRFFPRLFILCIKARPFRPRRGYVLDGPLYQVRLWCVSQAAHSTAAVAAATKCIFRIILLSFLFPYFIGSFTPSTTPARSTSAPFIITSLFTCQYSVHPARST